MTVKTVLLTLAFLVLFAPSEVSAAKSILNLVDVEIPVHVDGSPLGLDEVSEGIIAGCKRKKWSPMRTSEGRIEASIHVRSHTARVEITFDQNSYSINYLDSVNLDYNERKQKIHRNYNKWVTLLSRMIQEELAARA